MKFQEMFNEKGKKRPYVLGEDGREYFYYKDRTGYVLRDMCNEDIDEWLSVMKDSRGLTPLQIAIQKAAISQTIEKELDDNNSLSKTMIVLDPKGQLIGNIDFAENNGKGKMQLFLRDQKLVDTKGARVLEIVIRMNRQEHRYDELYIENTGKELIRVA